MKLNIDGLLKKIWLINGIIILAVAVVSLSIITYNLVIKSNYDPDERGVIVGDEKKDADEKGLELQTIVFSTPRRIVKSDIYIVTVEQKDYETPKSVSLKIEYAAEYDAGMQVNVIFLNQKKGTQKLLLDQKASINEMKIPFYASDSLQKNIFYSISLKDTDGNGRINSSDKAEYFISDLDGSNFIKILPDKYKVLESKFSEDFNSINFICSIIPNDKKIKEEHWDKTLLEYNIPSNKLIEHKELNELITRAKEIMLK